LWFCRKTGGCGTIVNPPNNALVVVSETKRAYLKCESDTADEIAWTYDGNTIISTPCLETGPQDVLIFSSYPKTTPSFQCNVNASLVHARMDTNILTIAGPYGCTDRNNLGVTETAMVIVLSKYDASVDSRVFVLHLLFFVIPYFL